jgi:hypothetical protein
LGCGCQSKSPNKKVLFENGLVQGDFHVQNEWPIANKKRASCLPFTREIGKCASTMNGFLDLIQTTHQG